MKRYLLAAICIVLCAASFNASAQGAGDAFNLTYIPPSPNAAALGKFGEYPVSLSTGIPSISVPLFSYKGINNGLSMDVSLAYHSGGVRVEEIAGNVGMGWALNAGGVISRTVRSLPDDDPTYGYLAHYPSSLPSTDEQKESAVKNRMDGEMDVFNFNFNGHAGSFVLNGVTGNPILIKKEAIKIQPIHSPASGGLPLLGFIVTDEQGIKYTFKDMETASVNFNIGVGTLTYASSYYLTNIVNPTTRDTVKLSYNTSNNIMYNFGSESSTNQYTTNVTVSTNTVFTTPAGINSTQTGKKIKTITFPDHTEFDFLYQSLSRCDLKGDSTLAEVRKKNSVTGQYKSFKLYQSYIDQYGLKYPYAPAPCDLGDGINSTSLRMRLDSVKETSTAATINPYKFAYNDSYTLPTTDSYHQDFWGFFNGSINGTPHLVSQYFDLLTGGYMLEGADRRCDSNAVSASTLTKITYPTGGTSQFDYEPNRAGDNKLIINYVGNHSVGLNNNSQTQSFVLNNTPEGQTINYNFSMGVWCPGVDHTCSYIYKIKSADDATTYASQIFTFDDLGTIKTSTLTLPNGTYHLTWEYNTPSLCSCSDQFAFTLSYVNSVPDSTQIGGGIRIKKITNYDGVNHANDVVKQYSYVNTDGTSSGYAADLPAFSHHYEDCTYYPNDPPNFPSETVVNDYLVRTATTNQPLALSQGGINYGRVEVEDIGPVSQGKEVDYFTSYKDYPPSIMGGPVFDFPFIPLQTQDWMIGLQTRQDIFDSGNHLLKKTLNVFDQYSPETTDTLTNFKVGVIYNNNCGGVFPTIYTVNPYYWLINQNKKIQTTTVDYDVAGDSLVTNHWFSYNPNYFTLSTDQTINSKGDTLKNYHYYPFDYSISGSVLGAMVDSNMIAKPVSNEYWRNVNHNWYVTGADAINYAAFNSTTQYLASQYYTMSTATPVPAATMGAFNPSVLLRVPALYELALTFNVYDGKANPLQLTQRTGPPTSYLWSYNKEMPIAQITNATYSTVETALGGSTTVDNFSNLSMPSKATTDSFLSLLGALLPNVQFNSYVYDPLTGTTSNTDQKGMTTYYEYDSLLRLLNVKDQYGNIVKSTTYHYQNQ